jgi:hypothetical protein
MAPSWAARAYCRIGAGGLESVTGCTRLDRPRHLTAAAAALTDAALALPGIDLVEIRHDAANMAAGAFRRLGYARIGERPARGPVACRAWRYRHRRGLAVHRVGIRRATPTGNDFPAVH